MQKKIKSNIYVCKIPDTLCMRPSSIIDLLSFLNSSYSASTSLTVTIYNKEK